MSKLVFCGCEKHHVLPTDPNVVELNGRHWHVRCAFRVTQETHVKAEADRALMLKTIRKLNRFKDGVLRLHSWRCGSCNQRLRGSTYKFYGEAVYHTHCLEELGGEG